MDALSEWLKVLRLEGAVFFDAHFTAPWCLESPRSEKMAPLLQPGAEKLLLYHLVTEGSCWISMDGDPPRQLQAGDLVMFPHGDAHAMSSQVSPRPPSMLDPNEMLRERPVSLQFGGGGEAARFVCGYIVCDPRLCKPVLSALPRMLVVALREEEQSRWLEGSLRYAAGQAASAGPGAQAVLAKLSEVLVMETLRRHASELPAERTGWLAGLRDPVVGRCLQLMHERPADPWTVESLARESASSRSVLAERFTQLVGATPMQYLTRWRMALGADLLVRTSMNVARIAQEVGYEGDTAFNRAFRREFDVPPATWRRQRAAAAAA